METKDILLGVLVLLNITTLFVKAIALTKQSSGWPQLTAFLYLISMVLLGLALIFNFSLAKAAYTTLVWIAVIVNVWELFKEWKNLKKSSFFTFLLGIFLALIMSIGYHHF